MARTYATIECSIWDDPDFCLLTAGAQRTYFMLITQPDISACGNLPMTLRRWGKTCSEKQLAEWLEHLAEARFIVMDDDTEEVFVRTFAKYDGGYRHAVRIKAVISTARAIRSPKLRDTAASELVKLGVSIATRVPVESLSSGTAEAVESCGSVVTEVSTDSTPESLNLNREPAPAEAVEDDPLSPFCPKHQPDGTTEPCGPCGTRRQALKARAESRLNDEIAAKVAANQARAECDMCNDKGIREHPRSGLPLGRCDHRRAS